MSKRTKQRAPIGAGRIFNNRKENPMKKPVNNRSANASDVAIGKRIRQRRNEQKVSQAELGDQLGVSFQQIQKYEKGTNRVGAARLLQVAKVLDCEVGFFLPSETRANASSVVDSFMATKDGLMIAQAFVRIANVNVRHTIARFVDDLSRDRASRMQAAE
jgi:transcriptional regulator with XRE-family HTH domain